MARAIREGSLSASAAVQESLERARQVQGATNAFVDLHEAEALEQAERADLAVGSGATLGPLHGVPFVVKANLCVEGRRATAGSAVLADYVPPYDATVVERLEAAGAIVVGSTNMDEFGMGSSSESGVHGPVRNPYDVERVAGGSSGGSAAAVAAGVVPFALGTDTGGSVRQPAAFCGVFGLKPSYGTLSRYGAIAYASSLDQVGVLARSAEDVDLVMRVMAGPGPDPRDATTSPDLARWRGQPGPRSLAGLRVGVVEELCGAGNDPAIADALEAFVAWLTKGGAEVVSVHVPTAKAGVSCYYLIATAEASSNLNRYDGAVLGVRRGAGEDGHVAVASSTRGRGFGPEVRRRVLMGSFALSAGHVDAWFGHASKVRRKVADELDDALREVDLLLTPTAPQPAFRLGEHAFDPVAMYLGDVDTCLANLAGLPAISLPTGTDPAGRPTAVQLMAARGRDERLVDVAWQWRPSGVSVADRWSTGDVA